MSVRDKEQPVHNLSGALIFTAYVISALSLTLLIAQNLYASHKKLKQSETSKVTRDLGTRLQIFTALAVLSFSTLSYHMLFYLVISYRGWARENGITLPQQLLGDRSLLGSEDQRVQLYVWQWLTSSTLFQDFAQTICGTSARFWWTQQALLVTMAWTVFMSFEGMF